MNISNALVGFTQQTVADAPAGTALKDAQIHADVYEEIKQGKTIRVDDLRTASPVLAPGRIIRKDNAIVNVFFIAAPVSQSLSDRLAARQTAEDMADEWLLKAFENPTLKDAGGAPRICNIGQVSQFNEWFKPGTVKMPVCVLRLKINPRS